MNRHQFGLLLGLLAFALLWSLPAPMGMPASAWGLLAVVALMAVWWVSEAIPIAATALLPIVLFPLLGIMGPAATTASYANHLIYLFMGGFLIAVTIERWNFHKRLALHTILAVGVSPRRMILGFMLASAVLSMWISNTATAMMMLPIGIAVIGQVEYMQPGFQNRNFGMALMLGIAYACSIGGTATLIGTPPNAILAGMAENLYGRTISFAEWISIGLPLSLIMLAITWFYVSRFVPASIPSAGVDAKQTMREELAALGPMRSEEKKVLTVFLLVALAWILRCFVHIDALNMVNDSTIAMLGALALFVIPSDWRKGQFLLDWQAAVKIPWDIIILFGGGFALAHGFSETGLTLWLADQLAVFENVPHWLLVVIVVTMVIFLTELTSNTASATILLPVLGSLAVAIKLDPYALMIPAAFAASYAFMLPVATPPNAIVFASRRVSIPQMARVGFWVNLIGILLITGLSTVLLPLAWDLPLMP